MTDLTKTLTKATLGTVAAGAMALASATPAMANDRQRDRGIDAGDVIAGALVIGGIAAIAGAFDNKRDRRFNNNRNYNNANGYNRGVNARGGGQRAIERCIRVAERQAQRFGGYRFADVTQIRDVDRTRNGWRVKGRMEVQGNRGFGGRNFDRGRFTCFADGRGRPQIDFRGLRGL